MRFKVSTSKEALQETSGGSYISQSGIYDVTVKFASVDVSKGGAESINFNLDYNGNSQTIYGPYVTDKAGNTLEIGAKLINKLAVINGMGDGDDFEIEEETHAVGKDNKEQEFAVITNFTDLPLKIRLQEEYSRNPKTSEITKKMIIKNFFREDGASAEEIVNGGEIGKRLETEQAKYASNVTYADSSKGAGDAPTPEEVAEWKAAKAAGAASATPKPKAKPAAGKTSGGLFK
jgi:hypothetical protein